MNILLLKIIAENMIDISIQYNNSEHYIMKCDIRDDCYDNGDILNW